MCKNVLCCCSLCWLLFKHEFHQVYRFLAAYIFFVFDFLIQLLDGVEISNLICFERNVSIKHCIQTNSGAPNIYWESFIAHIFYNFWCNISWSTTLFKKYFILIYFAGNSEVTYFNVAMAVQQNIIKLDISVSNLVLMKIGDALNYLLKHKFCVFFRELSTLAHIIEKVTTWT